VSSLSLRGSWVLRRPGVAAGQTMIF
jgi:hypothetical protein